MEFSNFIDVEAKSIDEAVEKALKTINQTKDQVKVEVLSENQPAKAKFFGFSMKSVKVRIHYNVNSAQSHDEESEEVIEEFDESKLSPIGKRAKDFLFMILTDLALDARLKQIQENEDSVKFILSSDNPNMIIGKNGTLLESLQALTYMAANKHEEKWKRILIDIDQYRERKEKNIEAFIRDIAIKVKRSRRAFLTLPYSPYDRKIIHTIIQDMDGLESESEGTGLYKRVWIKPR